MQTCGVVFFFPGYSFTGLYIYLLYLSGLLKEKKKTNLHPRKEINGPFLIV